MAAILTRSQCAKAPFRRGLKPTLRLETTPGYVRKLLTIRWDTPVKLPWIFPGAPLIFNGAPWNIQGNLPGMMTRNEIITTYLDQFSQFRVKERLVKRVPAFLLLHSQKSQKSFSIVQ